ncbi:MAG: hypothetical protein IPH62_16620 [Ignavibacteriae bacterium]|nr:hypothetical protein [Ignavibacteriota bacterium]
MNKNLFKNILLSFSTLFILIFLSEILLRFFYKPLNSGWGWDDSPRRNLSNFKNDFPNQLGLRGQNINYTNEDFVILILGDSQVEAATSSPNKMPEILLENYLSEISKKSVKVFSLAAAGWGQDQQLLTLEKYFENFRADLVLIWSTPKNDFWENTFPDRNVGKIAGHLKPTFKLVNNNLDGPFFTSNSYYKNSVFLQLVYSAIQNYKNQTIEQLVLDNWNYDLPESHNLSEIKKIKSFEVDLNEYSQNILQYKDSSQITILTHENFIEGRSHFTPYLIPKSKRDIYSIDITKKLIEKIDQLSNKNHAKLLVIYPIRDDFDIVSKKCVKFVKSYYFPENYFEVNLNFAEVLKQKVHSENLFMFKINGGDEICIDFKDRHLNDLGNDQVMKNVGEYISNKFFK